LAIPPSRLKAYFF